MSKRLTRTLLVILAIALVYYWWPQPVERTFQGYLTSVDGEVNESVEIKLLGKFHRSLISRHTFEGQVTIKDTTVSTIRSHAGSINTWWNWVLERWGGRGIEAILGYVNEQNIFVITGSIRIKSDFSEVAGYLVADNTENSAQAQSIFAGPASSRDQVLALYNALALGKQHGSGKSD